MEGFNVNKVDKKDGYLILNINGALESSEIFSFISKADILFGTYIFNEEGKIKNAGIVIEKEKGICALEKMPSFVKDGIKVEEDISLISVKGMGLSHNTDVLVKFYEVLYDMGIEVIMISKGETKILAAVSKDRAEDAFSAVSKGLYGM